MAEQAPDDSETGATAPASAGDVAPDAEITAKIVETSKSLSVDMLERMGLGVSENSGPCTIKFTRRRDTDVDKFMDAAIGTYHDETLELVALPPSDVDSSFRVWATEDSTELRGNGDTFEPVSHSVSVSFISDSGEPIEYKVATPNGGADYVPDPAQDTELLGRLVSWVEDPGSRPPSVAFNAVPREVLPTTQ